MIRLILRRSLVGKDRITSERERARLRCPVRCASHQCTGSQGASAWRGAGEGSALNWIISLAADRGADVDQSQRRSSPFGPFQTTSFAAEGSSQGYMAPDPSRPAQRRLCQSSLLAVAGRRSRSLEFVASNAGLVKHSVSGHPLHTFVSDSGELRVRATSDPTSCPRSSKREKPGLRRRRGDSCLWKHALKSNEPRGCRCRSFEPGVLVEGMNDYYSYFFASAQAVFDSLAAAGSYKRRVRLGLSTAASRAVVFSRLHADVVPSATSKRRHLPNSLSLRRRRLTWLRGISNAGSAVPSLHRLLVVFSGLSVSTSSRLRVSISHGKRLHVSALQPTARRIQGQRAS